MSPLYAGYARLAILMLLVPLTTLSHPASPLIIRAQGSFFLGGENKRTVLPAAASVPSQSGAITVNQMYVQYQVPMKGAQHRPIVLVHGCCLSGKSWETTPDGREGWGEYFLRRDRSVYLVDQVSRGRSGFDPSSLENAPSAAMPTQHPPALKVFTHELAWTVFRFGPKFGEVFPDQQFPMASVDEFYKQMIPDLNSTLAENPNPTWAQLATLGSIINGAVIIGHSEAGFFPEQAALIASKGISGIVSIETACETGLADEKIVVLAAIPTLIMFGDHLNDVKVNGISWADALDGCRTFADQLKKAGGDAEIMHLPALGIRGNSHMLMQDRNSDRLADLVLEWIDRHVEAGRSARPIKSARAKLSVTAAG